jgi:hypothetical protein
MKPFDILRGNFAEASLGPQPPKDCMNNLHNGVTRYLKPGEANIQSKVAI